MVPVLNKKKEPLMPCTEKRARKLMEKKKAKPFWVNGKFCIILQYAPKTNYTQEVAVGIDPGSKWEGLTVKSSSSTYLNVQTESKRDVKKKVETRRNLRRARRSRNLRYRKPRWNRRKGKKYVSPSTKARWGYKLSLLNWFRKMYPITHVAVEDICAKTLKGKKRWNSSFSPLQVGKNYFRKQIEKLNLDYREYKGFDTYRMRISYGLKKNSNKSKKDFHTHCVDSWCLANEVIGGHTEVDNTKTIFLSPIKRHRRQLHRQNPKKGGERSKYGGTRSLGIERGSLVKHPKYGFCLVGGSSKGRISLNSLKNNKRLCQNAKKEDIKIISNQKWNITA